MGLEEIPNLDDDVEKIIDEAGPFKDHFTSKSIVNVKVHGRKVIALMDTGAQLNLVSTKFIELFQANFQSLPFTPRTCRGLGNRHISTVMSLLR